MAVVGRHLRKALGNSAWLLLEQFISLGLALVVGIFVARYLGPYAFGSLSYATALVALLGTINYLGLGGTVVKALVHEPDSTDEILGTVFILKLLASLASLILAFVGALLIVEDSEQRNLVLLVALAMPIETFLVLRLFFEARVSSRSTVIVTSIAAATGAAARLAGIISQAPLWVFAATIPFQVAVAAVGLVIIYARTDRPIIGWRPSLSRAKSLMKTSWPLLLSSAGAVLYLKLDQFMLGEMIGMEAVGVYAVAARISELSYVLPTILGASIAPRLLQLHKMDRNAYELRLRRAFRYMFWLGLGIAVLISLSADFLIITLFGDEFRSAAPILRIHIWACPAVFMGVILQKWFLAEDLLIYSFTRHLFGAGVNVFLNLILIPRWGGVGAAIATIIAYTIASYLACFMRKQTIQPGIWMTEAILWPFLLLAGRLRRSSSA